MPETLNGPDSAGVTGFFGKLPSHGDFVSRYLPRGFTEPWDNWLQAVIATSREQLAEHWLDIYLTSPIWRFALSSGLCGPSSWAGVVMPSVDRVGRYFPLTLASSLKPGFNQMRLLSDAEDWFTQMESLALSCLEDPFDMEDFDQTIQHLTAPTMLPGAMQLNQSTGSHPAWQFNLTSVDSAGSTMACIGQTLLDTRFQTYSLWWTQGSERIEPSLLISEGMPPVSGFSGLLDGQWNQWGWGQYAFPQQPADLDANTDQTAPQESRGVEQPE